MDHKLLQLLDPYRAISIIGMCKNAGKTTVLNRLIRAFARHGETLALTSIGRDGEDQDRVTGTKKPGIYIPEGTLAATAADLLLHRCDVSKEILDTTGISTPMGQVVLLRAHSDGAIELAGPSMVSQLAQLREKFTEFGADRVLIDGALSRKSLCSRRVSDATILCTGASYHKDLDTVVADTAYHCRLLTLPLADEPLLAQIAEDRRDNLVVTNQGLWPVPAGMALEDALRCEEAADARAVFFGGALTDLGVRPLILSGKSMQGMKLVVRDSSKILLKQENFEKLQRKGVQIQALESVNLVALTVNPFSAYGLHFDGTAFLEKMQEKVALPVLNVMEEGAIWR